LLRAIEAHVWFLSIRAEAEAFAEALADRHPDL
jgi:hypothetical protein